MGVLTIDYPSCFWVVTVIPRKQTIMKYELNEVKFSTEGWSAEELGTLKAGMVKGDKLRFAKFKPNKSATILVTEKGKDAPNKQIVLSKALSVNVKSAIANGLSAIKALKMCLTLQVIKNDTGYFLISPQGAIGEDFLFEEVEKTVLEVNEIPIF